LNSPGLGGLASFNNESVASFRSARSTNNDGGEKDVEDTLNAGVSDLYKTPSFNSFELAHARLNNTTKDLDPKIQKIYDRNYPRHQISDVSVQKLATHVVDNVKAALVDSPFGMGSPAEAKTQITPETQMYHGGPLPRLTDRSLAALNAAVKEKIGAHDQQGCSTL
jgi:hypothetical protein